MQLPTHIDEFPFEIKPDRKIRKPIHGDNKFLRSKDPNLATYLYNLSKLQYEKLRS